jgi:hypothetical protein
VKIPLAVVGEDERNYFFAERSISDAATQHALCLIFYFSGSAHAS